MNPDTNALLRPSYLESPSAKFIDFHRVLAEYGIQKTKARQLIADGYIQTIKIVNKGRSRGRVLVVRKSLDDYLAKLAKEQGIENY